MPLTPQVGAVRLRAFQLGLETTPFTQHAATRRLPWTFTPNVDPHITFSTADTGTLDYAIAPYQLASDVTGTAAAPDLFFNDLPNLYAAAIKGGVTPVTVGSVNTWTYQPVSTSQDVFDTQTGEWYDDATADAWAGAGGVVDAFTLTSPVSTGAPISLSSTWRFSQPIYPATPTGALSVDLNPVPLFGTDTVLYIDSAAGSIGISPILDSVYDWSLTYNNNLDVKRFQNGSNTRNKVRNYGRGLREITAVFNFAKTTAAIAEAVKWLTTPTVERFVELETQSTVLISGSTYYNQKLSFGGYWTVRGDTTINSNTGFQLTCHNVQDGTLGFPFKAVVVNTRATL